MPNGVEFEGRLAHVGTFPIGIEPGSFIEVKVSTPRVGFLTEQRLNRT